MSEETYCLLCLERIQDPTEQIDIDSAQGRTQEMQKIIEKYFKEELNGVISSMSTHILCRSCWNAVSTFHEFCLRVQRAHLTSVNILRLSSAYEIATIKEECEVNEEAPLNAVPERRRRGRPRRQTATKSTTNIQELPECKVVIEKINMSCIENKDEIQIPIAKDNIKLENNNVEDLKHEALQEECMDADYTPDDTDSDYMANSMSPKDCLNDSDTELEEIKSLTKKRNKKNLSLKTIKMLEADEYIAKNFKLSCCLCNAPLENFTSLQTHFQKQHQRRGYVLCCGKKLLKRGVLVDHIHMHENPDYFKCARCGKVMANRNCYEMHQKNHDFDRKRIYKCKDCGKSFFREVILMRHVLIHVPEEQKKHACPQCGKTFPTRSTMDMHLKLVHLNVYAKICDICGKSIRGRSALRLHMEQHKGIVQAPIQCEVCGATLANKRGLKRHMRTLHDEEQPIPQTCPICAKVSPSMNSHKNHMKNVHGTERKYTCSLCSKAFKWSKHLKEHMSTHTGEVLYTCTFCPKTFNSNANMYSHRKKKHPKEWAQSRQQKFTTLQMRNQIQSENDVTAQKEATSAIPQ